MRVLQVVAVLLVATSAFLSAPAMGADKSAGPKDLLLRKELLERVEVDQAARRRFMELMSQKKDAAPDQTLKLDDATIRQLQEVDHRNTAWLKEVIGKQGWPRKSLVGADGANAAWLLVQHADHDLKFQKECLGLLEKAVASGEASANNLAYLVDRVRAAEGKPQVYGTQLDQKAGKLEPKPIEDAAHVDERRRAVGLEPLAEYLALASREFKATAPAATTAATSKGTYPQLISVRRTADEARRPAADLGFVDQTKLPRGSKVLSAAKGIGGAVWVVTDKGAFRLEGEKFVPLDVGPRRLEPSQPTVTPSLKAVSVAADRIGQIWVATDGGLFATDAKQWWQPLDRSDGVPFESMTCLHLARSGDVWGGTREGAWRLRDGQFRYFWGKRWLPGKVVRAIWTDDDGRAWLETDGGLSTIEERPLTLAEKAAHFDEITQKRHLRRGFVSEIHLQVPGDPAQGSRFEISDNDGLWNAIYVGAMAFRFAATKDPAARDQARVALDAMLELERLTGIPGYPARAVVTDDELKAGVDGVNLDETVRVPGETDKIWFRSPVDPKVWCKGDTSSDEIDGHYFAWYVYHDLVADEAEKKKIVAVVRRTTDHILEHGLTLVGHTGRKTRWGMWAPEVINHDPFWAATRPLNSLEILGFLKVAHHITQDDKYARAYDELTNRHHYLLNALLDRRRSAGQWWGINHSDDELLYLVFYPLLRLERDADRRRVLVQCIARTWEDSPTDQTLRSEHSPLYNFIYGATTGKPCDVEAAAATLQDWPWDMLHWRVQNRHRHDVQFKTGLGMHPPDPELEIDRVLPASERRLSRWNGNPFAPDGGDDARTEDDGAAWSLAYWLGVYHGYLPRE